MVLLKVSYRVRAHHVARFEAIFQQEIRPLIDEHGLRLQGIWKTLVGNAGEFMELWEFNDLTEFERHWPKLLSDPRLLKIFRETGPMVDDENFTLMSPAANS